MPEAKTCPSCGATLAPDAPEGLCPACLMKGAMGSPESGVTVDLSQSPQQPSAELTATPAERFIPPSVEDLRPHFPQLELIELLGKGGMGAVYKARQVALDRTVALKILPPETGRDPHFAERFTREARALARLNHTHITTVYEFGQAGGYYYFLMEFVDGVNLRQALRTKSITTDQALAIVPQVCDALQYAHDEGIVHRDIKPENILLEKKGRVKIADFGLAKLLNKSDLDRSLTGSAQAMGTLHYMAPEQLENPLAVDHRADVYSLGVVFYEMLTGELPLGRFALPSQKAHVDIRLDDVVLKSLERERERRYQHVSEVKTDVQTISSSAAQPKSAAPAAAAAAVIPAVQKPIQERVTNAAWGLRIAGIVGVIGAMGLAPCALYMCAGPGLPWFSSKALPLTQLIAFPVNVFIIVASVYMMQFRSLSMCKAACWLAILPLNPSWLLSLPMGIWGLSVLSDREVAASFTGDNFPLVGNAPAAPSNPIRTLVIVGMVGAGCLLCLLLAGIAIPVYFRTSARTHAAREAQPMEIKEVISELLIEIAELKGIANSISPSMPAREAFASLESYVQELQLMANSRPVEAPPALSALKARELINKSSLMLAEIKGTNTTGIASFSKKVNEIEASLAQLRENADAIAALSGTDFQTLLSRIRQEPFDNHKSDILRPAAKKHRFTSAQAKTLVAAFTFRDGQMESTRLLYHRTTDPENYHQVLDALTFPQDKKALQVELGL